MADKWTTVSELAMRYDRSKNLILKWIQHPEITKKKKGNGWKILDNQNLHQAINGYQAKSRPRLTKVYQRDQLLAKKCPHCLKAKPGDWVYLSRHQLKDKNISLRLECNQCNTRFSVWVPASMDHGLKRGSNTNRQRFYRADRFGPHETDTIERVEADQRKWIAEYIQDGLSLNQILNIFGPKISAEITHFYQETIHERRTDD